MHIWQNIFPQSRASNFSSYWSETTGFDWFNAIYTLKIDLYVFGRYFALVVDDAKSHFLLSSVLNIYWESGQLIFQREFPAKFAEQTFGVIILYILYILYILNIYVQIITFWYLLWIRAVDIFVGSRGGQTRNLWNYYYYCGIVPFPANISQIVIDTLSNGANFFSHS